jgi:next-to-BRCA1 protein 1
VQLRQLLQVAPGQDVLFERYSDSAGAYVTLDANKPQVYKTLFRAAKAKLKLQQPLSVPSSSLHRMSAETLSSPCAEATLPPPPIAHSSPLFSSPPQPALMMAAQTSPVSPLVADAEVKGEAPVPQPFTTTTATQLTARQSKPQELSIKLPRSKY